MIDGQIDYSSYTRAQLFDALRHIDRGRYPLNLANLERTLAARAAEPPVAEIVQTSGAQERPRHRWIWVTVCSVVVLAGAGIASVLFWSAQKDKQMNAAALEYVRANPEAVARLGTTVTSTSFTAGGRFNFGPPVPRHVTMAVTGPTAKGVVTGDMKQDGNRWTYEKFSISIEGQTEPVELSQNP